jgi:hypothetical protein
VRTRSSPASSDEVAVAEHKIDAPLEVGKRALELLGDQRLSGGPRSCSCRTKVVTDVVVGKHFLGELDVSTGPNLLVEPTNECLVRIDIHASPIVTLVGLRGCPSEMSQGQAFDRQKRPVRTDDHAPLSVSTSTAVIVGSTNKPVTPLTAMQPSEAVDEIVTETPFVRADTVRSTPPAASSGTPVEPS